MKGINCVYMKNIEDGFYRKTKIIDERPCAKGRWVSARPIGITSLRHRIKCAWLVFTGSADILYWEGDQ